jgi:pimeloyl-ACP methyl ester carboxylesterase
MRLPDGRPTLAVRRGQGPRRPFLLVHGLASNARLWDGVATHLLAAEHDVVAVDQRGHGRSPAPADGYDTATCAADLAALIAALGWTGDRAPVVAGQSWGGNVALCLAAEHGGAAAVCCVDGGWIRLADHFATFADCWGALAPPDFTGMRFADLAARVRAGHADWPPGSIDGALANLVETPDGGVRARLAREHHRAILRSLFETDPHDWYPAIDLPVLLCPAWSSGAPDPRSLASRAAVEAAATALRHARVRPYVDADHDLHAQHPAALAADLLALAAELPGAPAEAEVEATVCP